MSPILTVADLIELLQRFPPDAPTAYIDDDVVYPLIDDEEVCMSADGVVLIGLAYEEEFEKIKAKARKGW